MKVPSEKAILNGCLYISAIILLCYTGYRSFALSMTHDESNTYMWFNEISVWSCFFSKDCWPNANNHLLNTFLYQISIAIFGHHTWSIRLPNVLGHLLFLVYSIQLIKLYKPVLPIALASFFIINGNPYLLDFFSLARGYGLSVSMAMISIFYLLRFEQSKQINAVFVGFFFGMLAVMANFVAFNFWMGICVAFSIMLLVLKLNDAISWKRLFSIISIPLVGSAILIAALIKPIQFLEETGDFGFGMPTLISGLKTMVQNSFYGALYLGQSTFEIALWAYVMVMLFAIGLAIYFLIKNDSRELSRHFVFISLVLFCCLFIMQIQNLALGTQFPDHRKTVTWILISSLTLFYLLLILEKVNLKNRWITPISGVLVSFAMIYHLFRVGNLTYSLEWFYDMSTKSVVEFLEENIPEDQQPAMLAANWVFTPTLLYYHDIMNIKSFEPSGYSNEITADEKVSYYYIFDTDFDVLKDDYEIYQSFPPGMLLLKRKNQ